MKNSVKAIVAALSSAVICAAPTVATFTGSAAVPAITAEAASNTATFLYGSNYGLNGVMFEINKSNRTADIVGYADTHCTNVTVPETIICGGYTYKVKRVRDNAFNGVSWITKVDLSACTYLESIGNAAFKNTKVATIDLNTKLTTIGVDAFRNTPVTYVKIPGGVKTICNNAFYNCTSLKEIFFQSASVAGLATDTPLKIQSGAFAYNTKLTHVDTYRKVYNMESGAFRGSNNITWYEGVGRNSFASQYKK